MLLLRNSDATPTVDTISSSLPMHRQYDTTKQNE